MHGRLFLPSTLDLGDWCGHVLVGFILPVGLVRHCRIGPVRRRLFLPPGLGSNAMPDWNVLSRSEWHEPTVPSGYDLQCDRHVVGSALSRWISLLGDSAVGPIGPLRRWLLLSVWLVVEDGRWTVQCRLCVPRRLIGRHWNRILSSVHILPIWLDVAFRCGQLHARLLLRGQRR